jgi:S-adenosylmethionine decarboxylase
LNNTSFSSASSHHASATAVLTMPPPSVAAHPFSSTGLVPKNLGRHLLAEFFDCNPNVINNNPLIEQLMKEAAVACGATIVQSCFHHFNPYGVSGVVVIAESHLTIHTWPEYGYASVDLYTCGDQCDPAVAFDYLQEKFHSAHCSYVEFKRGLMCDETGNMLKAPAAQIGDAVVRVQESHHVAS